MTEQKSIADSMIDSLASHDWTWLITRYLIGYVLFAILLSAFWGYVYRPSKTSYLSTNSRLPWTNQEVVINALWNSILWPFEIPLGIAGGIVLGLYEGARFIVNRLVDQAAKALPESQRQPGFQLHSKLSLNGGSKREQLR